MAHSDSRHLKYFILVLSSSRSCGTHRVEASRCNVDGKEVVLRRISPAGIT